MTDRRAFLKQSATLAALGTDWLTGAQSALPEDETPAAAPALIPDATARVPDTLDLAEHGRPVIHGMLGSLDPALDYECVFLNILDVHPADMLHWSSMIRGVSVTDTMVNLADPQNSREQYRCEFRGHTAVDVQRLVVGSDPQAHTCYRLFRRQAMSAAAAPEKPMPAYVHPEKLINWLMLV